METSENKPILPERAVAATMSTGCDTMEDFFGSCTNHGECQEACPKEISIDFIALMNKDYLASKFKNRRLLSRK